MASKKGNFLGKSIWRIYSQVLISGALIAVILAGLGYLGSDIWLASTQWLIVAAVLAGFGVYAKLSSFPAAKAR